MIYPWPPERIPHRLTFISDLHLFSSRCNAHEHHSLIESAVEWSDMCVWGGDLFDFRWSGDPHGDRTVRDSIDWLQQWYDRFPNRQFVYLAGNHDAHPPFASALRRWAAQRKRFECDIDCLRVGNTLLTHGDVIEGNGSQEAFARYRLRWSGKPPAGRLRNHAYDIAIAARVHCAIASAAHRKKNTCLRLLRWIHQQPRELTAGVERVIFGHTHRIIRGLWVDQIRFYNGGAAIRHVPFEPVRIELSEDN